MKNRRNVVIAILLIAVLCVGIGYAALTSSISFTGNILYTPKDFSVYWASLEDAGDVLKSETVTDSAITVTMDTTDWALNDTKTLTATVKNKSRYDAINVQVGTATVDNYTIETSISKNTVDADDTDSAIVTIKITMTAYPAAALTEAAPATFTFNVTADQGPSK